MAKNPLIVTPKGLLKYPRLFTPDTKFKAEGEYKTSLVLPPKEAAPLIEQLMAIHKETYVAECAAKKKKVLKQAGFPWKKETNADGEETGNIEFRASQKAVIEYKGEKIELRPQVFDAKKHPVDKKTKVGSGTLARIQVEVAPWFTDALGFGIQLRLRAVQIIDLVEFSGGDASSAFEEEDGYSTGEDTADTESAAEDSTDDADDAPPPEPPKGKGGKPKPKTGDF